MVSTPKAKTPVISVSILEVEAPTHQDFVRWRKRWKNRWKISLAPVFWKKFYKHQFKQASTEVNLLCWGKLVALIKSVLSVVAVEQLREAYQQEKYYWENF
jgi:hypothetical protein